MKKQNIFIIFFMFMGVFLFGQPTVKQILEEANEAYNKGDYGVALVRFDELKEKESQNAEFWYHYAKAAQEEYAYSKAEMAYQTLIDTLDSSQYPDIPYNLGKIKQSLGKYAEAKDYFNLYLSESEGDDEKLTRLAHLGLTSSEYALDQLATKANDTQIIQLDNGVNTPYSEHAPLMYNDELYYTSLRFINKHDFHNPKREVSKILKSANNMTGEPIADGEEFNNGKMLTSSISVSPTGDFAVFSICNYVEGDNIHCNLYRASLDESGTMGEATKLPSNINNDLFTTTQPSISKEGEDLSLYFVSNRADGNGGMDIWKTKFLDNNEFSDPINLTEINTLDDDISPFFHNRTNTLYFSSNGRPGMGSFDIYKTTSSTGSFGMVENLGKEINSSFNDIFYSLNESGEEGYFSSNRFGSQYLEEKFETCCYDIYKAELDVCDINLLALVFDDVTKEGLVGTTLIITDESNGSEKIIELSNLEGNDYKVDLDCDKTYKITATKDGYAPASVVIHPIDPNDPSIDRAVEKKLYLKPMPVLLMVTTFDKASGANLNGATVKLIDLSNGDVVIAEKTNDSGNDFSFELIPGHEYKIVGTKYAYTGDEDTFLAPSISGSTISKELYLEKANIELDVFTFEKRTRAELNGATVTLVDVTNGEVILTTKYNELANDFKFFIAPGKVYELRVTKPKFKDEVERFEVPANARGTIRKDVYLGAEDEFYVLSNLIPVKLYFDNDEPNKRTMKTTTNKNYTGTYHLYYPRKKEFTYAYAKQFKGDQKASASAEVEFFFEQELNKGFRHLAFFLDGLDEVLKTGREITIYLRGYASPLSASDYNIALGKRRIDCVRNEFSQYKNGLLSSYIKSGQLKITERSFGEDTADNKVSDDPNKPESSIYSPEASRERRIEIDEIVEIN